MNTGGSSPFQPEQTDEGVDGNAGRLLHYAWKRHVSFDGLGFHLSDGVLLAMPSDQFMLFGASDFHFFWFLF